LLISFIVLFVHLACGQPTAPRTFPPSWYTWLVTTIVQVGVEKPLYDVGQLVAYNIAENWSCRLNQQNLINPQQDRPVDYCDYTTGKHYMLDSTLPEAACSGQTDLAASMGVIMYPQEYLAVARFFGVDHVNQKDCNHFVANDIMIEGKLSQLDVWTAVDNSFPCQISYTELSTKIITNWAFDGFSTSFPIDTRNQCLATKIMCTQADWLCHPIPNINPQLIINALAWVCDPIRINCSPIQPGGPFYEPNTPQDHAKWAFNAYYLLHRTVQGPAACSFGGIATLVQPPTSTQNITLPAPKSILALISNDITCERAPTA